MQEQQKNQNAIIIHNIDPIIVENETIQMLLQLIGDVNQFFYRKYRDKKNKNKYQMMVIFKEQQSVLESLQALNLSRLGRYRVTVSKYFADQEFEKLEKNNCIFLKNIDFQCDLKLLFQELQQNFGPIIRFITKSSRKHQYKKATLIFEDASIISKLEQQKYLENLKSSKQTLEFYQKKENNDSLQVLSQFIEIKIEEQFLKTFEEKINQEQQLLQSFIQMSHSINKSIEENLNKSKEQNLINEFQQQVVEGWSIQKVKQQINGQFKSLDKKSQQDILGSLIQPKLETIIEIYGQSKNKLQEIQRMLLNDISNQELIELIENQDQLFQVVGEICQFNNFNE